jgi:proline racemase
MRNGVRPYPGVVDIERAVDWSPPEEWQRVTVIDSHAGGEPFRVLVGGQPEIPGATVLEKRAHAKTHLDHLRRILMWEPRGHADMYGGWIGPPVSPGADLSVLFLHNEGFSTMCGHGIIALTKVVFDTEIVIPTGDSATLVIDTPAGRVTSTATFTDGLVDEVSFVNVPSFVLELDGMVIVPGYGEVGYDLAFGGAFYAYVEIAQVDVAIDDVTGLIHTGRAIKQAVAGSSHIIHPSSEDLGFIYGVIFTGPPEDPANHSRHVCVFADGEVDRSPTGTGVSGRLAILHARHELGHDQVIGVESIVGSRFTGRVVGTTAVGSHAAVVPEITGTAHILGRSEFWVDPADLLGQGFLLR